MINKPPGWLYFTALAVATFITFQWTSLPFPYFEAGVFGLLVWVPLVLWWAARLFVAVTAGSRQLVMPKLRAWLLIPVIVVGGWALVHFDVPFQARFALSRAAMQDFAEGGGPECQWAGRAGAPRWAGQERGGEPRGAAATGAPARAAPPAPGRVLA